MCHLVKPAHKGQPRRGFVRVLLDAEQLQDREHLVPVIVLPAAGLLLSKLWMQRTDDVTEGRLDLTAQVPDDMGQGFESKRLAHELAGVLEERSRARAESGELGMDPLLPGIERTRRKLR